MAGRRIARSGVALEVAAESAGWPEVLADDREPERLLPALQQLCWTRAAPDTTRRPRHLARVH